MTRIFFTPPHKNHHSLNFSFFIKFLLVSLCLFLIELELFAESPTTVKGAILDPRAAVLIRTPSGSLQENEIFEKTFQAIASSFTTTLPVPESPGIRILTPQGSEIIKELPSAPVKRGLDAREIGLANSVESPSPEGLIPPELPKAGPLRQPPNPWTHGRSYALRADADVQISVMGPGGRPIHVHHVPLGDPGAKAGENRVILWEGKDPMGFTAPPGLYPTILRARYPDGSEEIQMFFLEQP